MNRRASAAALALWAFSSQAAAADAAGDTSGLRAYLSRSLKTTDEIQYRAAEADLDGDGANEIVVYLTSPEYCGSGGCNTLVLKRSGGGYRMVMRATITRLPIRVLDTRHNGWRDIGVMVGGGGITSPYEAALSFDGRHYPYNPTVPPARRLPRAIGTTLIGGGQ